jgi:hypothetical protein
VVLRAVPRALEGMMTIDSMDFVDDYYNPESEKYKELATNLEDEVKKNLFLIKNCGFL